MRNMEKKTVCELSDGWRIVEPPDSSREFSHCMWVCNLNDTFHSQEDILGTEDVTSGNKALIASRGG